MAGGTADRRVRGFRWNVASRLTIGLVLLASVPVWAQPSAGPKWGPHIDLEAKPGTKRSLGEGDAFIPLAQDAATLLFANLRFRFDDSNGNEGNYGLGVRHMLESGWNLGGYGYFDRRRSQYGNYFHQVTFGLEALSTDWDARANYYAPVGRTTHLVDALSTAEAVGSTVVFRGGEERSMGGFDAELGWRVPIFDVNDGKALRVYGGGYRFADDGLETIAGPRARIEMTFDSLPNSWEGSRFSVGAEWQHDDPRGSQGFLTARLRIPLQVYGRPSSQLTPMERRMADPIVRDIDVVSQGGAFGAPEVARTLSGGNIVVTTASAAIGTDLSDELAAAGANATVVLTGTFNTTAPAQLQAGQTLLGSGSLQVQSASGRTAVLALPAATINATFASSGGVIDMANDSRVIGMTLALDGSSSQSGIRAFGLNNVVIANNTVSTNSTGSSSHGITVWDSSNAVVTGNTITVTSTAGSAIGMQLVANSANNTVAVSNNRISVTASGFNEYGLNLGYDNGFNLALSGAGNMLSHTCSTSYNTGTITGSIGVTVGVNTFTCP